jgi:hypothetical protein
VEDALTKLTLESIDGGQNLLRWMNGDANFADAEISAICLNRVGQSELRMTVYRDREGLGWTPATVTFCLEGNMDATVEAFAENVVERITLQRSLSPAPLNARSSYSHLDDPVHRIDVSMLVGGRCTILATIVGISVEEGVAT